MAQAAARAEEDREELQITSLADVQPQVVKWLWPNRIPLGKVTVIYGETGIGKTSLGLDLAARVSTGAAWPDEEENAGPGRVLSLNGEDSPNETVSPKLIAAGADLKKISSLGKIQNVGKTRRPRRFDLGRDIAMLRQRLEALPDVKLVLIDSLELFSGVLGLTKPQMRGVLADLDELAAEHGVAIVILSGATKCDLPVKNLWRVDRDVGNSDLRYWVPARFGWEDYLSPGLPFCLDQGRVVWGGRCVPPKLEQLSGATKTETTNSLMTRQVDWLRSFLRAGPQPTKSVLAAASVHGWSAGQMRRAKEALYVACWKEQVPQGCWMWDLPRGKWALAPTVVYGRDGTREVKARKDVEDAKVSL